MHDVDVGVLLDGKHEPAICSHVDRSRSFNCQLWHPSILAALHCFADILDRFNIVGKKDLFPNQLSGGQQQLVAIARAVVAKPTLILADEPTGNLHSDQGKEIMELFKKLNEAGTTIIQVTHSETNASYGSRVVNLRDGWVVDE